MKTNLCLFFTATEFFNGALEVFVLVLVLSLECSLGQLTYAPLCMHACALLFKNYQNLKLVFT